MIEEIKGLLKSTPDQIEEGGWTIRDLRPIKQAILLLAYAVEGRPVPGPVEQPEPVTQPEMGGSNTDNEPTSTPKRSRR